MVRLLYVLATVALVVAVGSVSVGCTGELSNQAAHDAIWSYVCANRQLYPDAVGVKVVEIGDPASLAIFGRIYDYYPVKAVLTVKSGATLQNVYTVQKKFSVAKDEFGDWQAMEGSF